MSKTTDTYQTLKAPSEGVFRDRGSKFIAYASRVYSEEEIKKQLEFVKKEHPKARHHCYSYRLGMDKNRYRANDDGEPSGTAGRPILGQIDSFGLTNVLVVVVRYFGGTKLGVPGLINAYKTSAAEALNAAEIEERTVDVLIEVQFGYPVMNTIMQLIKRTDCEVLFKEFEADALIQLAVRKDLSERLMTGLGEVEGVEIEVLGER